MKPMANSKIYLGALEKRVNSFIGKDVEFIARRATSFGGVVPSTPAKIIFNRELKRMHYSHNQHVAAHFETIQPTYPGGIVSVLFAAEVTYDPVGFLERLADRTDGPPFSIIAAA